MTLIPLWTSEELRVVLESEGKDSWPHWNCYGVSIDSRTVENGDLFFALDGDNFDGHKYAKGAIDQGAVGVVVSRIIEAIPNEVQILVPDVRQALVKLGLAGRARVDIPIIAVTGSVGKTGTKEALRAALSRHKKTHASVLSYNNDIGVPLSLARMPSDAGYGIFELGMNHSGELRELVKMVRPHLAIITTVAAVHSEFFSSVEEIADAKAEVFETMEGGGIVLLNHDNEHFERLKTKAQEAGVENIISFGVDDKSADIYAERHFTHETCSCVVANILGKIMTYKIGMLGDHWVMNSLAILGAVELVKGDLGLAGLELAELKPLKGRGRRQKIFIDSNADASFLLIDESYNANPTSMRAAFSVLRQSELKVRGASHIAVLGDMAELGLGSKEYHISLAKDLEKAGIRRVYATGKYMKFLIAALPENTQAKHFKNSDDLMAALRYEIQVGDVIMVKGSNASGMGKLVENLNELQVTQDDMMPNVNAI